MAMSTSAATPFRSWRIRASLGLACAQATTLASQVFGTGNPQSRARRSNA